MLINYVTSALALLLVVSLSRAYTCPRQCNCRNESLASMGRHVAITCFVRDIRDVDTYTLATNEERYTLDFHCETEIPREFTDNIFGYQPKLTALTLRGCKISYIYKDAFSGLPNLQELRIHSASSFHMQFHPGALNDTRKLMVLECTKSGILKVPNLCNLEYLTTLNLTTNSIVSFNSSGLACGKATLKNLKILDLSENYIQSLDELEMYGSAFPGIRILNMAGNKVNFTPDDNSFVHFQELAVLDMSSNKIEILPELLTEAKELQELILSNNLVKDIPENFFKSSNKILKVEIQNNNLGDDIWLSLTNLQNLLDLDISNNELTFLNQTTLQKLANLRHLHLAGNQISGIPVRTFQNHQNLQTLNLAGNHIQKIEQDALFGLFYLTKLELQNNGIYSISPDFLNPASALSVFNISNNFLSELPNLEKLGSLTILDARSNIIDIIAEKTFIGQRKIEVINLSYNNILEIPDSIFLSCKSLVRLDVSNNQLQYLHPSLFMDLKIEKLFLQRNNIGAIGSVFRTLMDLQELDLSNNTIRDVIQRNMFPPSLEMLDLSRNRIKTIRPQAFDGLDNIRMVDLRYNEIRSLSSDALKVSTRRYSQTGFRINNNPLQCDCKLTWLKYWDQSTHGPIIVNLNTTWCEGAYNYPASPVKLVPADRFLCRYTSVCNKSCKCCSFEACDCKYTCPENCACYHSTDYNTTHYVKCLHENVTGIDKYVPRIATSVDYSGSDVRRVPSAVFIGMVNLQKLFLNNTNLEGIENGAFVGLPKLRDLHLENNSLETLNKEMFKDLEHLEKLYLDYNKLSNIPKDVFSKLTSLQVLSLSNNHFMNMGEPLTNVLFSSVQVILHSNPWKCDCVLYFCVRERKQAFISEPERLSSLTSRVYCSNGISRTTDVNDLQKICEQAGGLPTTVTKYEEISLQTHRPEVESPADDNANVPTAVREIGSVSHSRDGNLISQEMNTTVWDDRLKIFIPAIVAGTVVLIVIILVAFRREFINCWLFTKFRCKSDNLDLLDNKRRYFDAFVSYHRRDENYVIRELCARLERGSQRYILQLQHRDHPRETSELTYIEKSVKSSQRTIVVLSNDFLTDNSLLKCVTQCVRQDSIGRLIVITFGKINSSNLDPVLQQNLKQGKHIRTGERWFWEKLYYCLPEPGKLDRVTTSCAEAHPYASTDLSRLSSAMADNQGYEEPPYPSSAGQTMPTLYEYNMPSVHGYGYGGSENSSNIYEEIKDQVQPENVSVKYAEPWKERDLEENVLTLTLPRPDKQNTYETV